MAVARYWNLKKGEIKFDDDVTETIDLFGVDGHLVGFNRLRRTPEGWEYMTFPYLFDDKLTVKECLGLVHGYSDIFEGHDIKLTLYRNMWSKSDLKKLISLFVQRTGNLTLEILDTAPENKKKEGNTK